MGGRCRWRFVDADPALPCRSLAGDESGMTAVIEFLSAFVLFLMIVTAYLSLVQLSLGANEPGLDRLDRAASEGLQRLTDDEGLFVPWQEGNRDLGNATSDWHLVNASMLIGGDVLPGLVTADGVLAGKKLSALQNLSERQFARGIGLDESYQFKLVIKVVNSDDSSRIDTILFDDGTPRTAAKDSSTASRVFALGDELVRITLEVHDGAQHFPSLRITEFQTRPIAGQPEWIEMYNPNGFAVNMSGWGLMRQTGSSAASVLFESGVLPGGEMALYSGWAELQESGNASFISDLSESGLLGVGAQDGLGDVSGSLSLTYADITSTGTIVFTITWNQTWRIGVGDSIIFLGGSPGETENWNVTSTPSPGNW